MKSFKAELPSSRLGCSKRRNIRTSDKQMADIREFQKVPDYIA